ncbi:MAG TPA: serine hydrolase domain-containing protein [Polyangiaceae bacterium]|nr:serine hydrolase domain-containing protein [Polyangiaceae bacterium]
METHQLAEVLTRRVIEPGVAPAASAGFCLSDGAPCASAAGRLPEAAASTATIFDLASVSKPVVACTAARLASRGVLELSTPLGQLLPVARGTRSEQVPLELLLAHRAGLEAHQPLFAPLFAGRALQRDQALAAAANSRRPECHGAPPAAGFAPVYSDMGYALVGAALEAVTGLPLDECIRREVSEPLGLALGSARQLRERLRDFDRRVAPTEVVRARGGCLRGVVHDENAWALSGHACSGHAGLFGTIEDVLGFGRGLLQALGGSNQWLTHAALWPLLEPRPGGSLRAGFDGKSEVGSSAGALAGRQTFGHLGFTGTSLWCDPGAGVAVALLTNRVHPTRDNPRIRAARPQVHDALFRAAMPVLPAPPDP